MPHRNRLLVEGKDDKHVVQNVCAQNGITAGQFETKEKDGVENILDTLDVELLASDLENLGIIVDADLDIDARWRSIAGRLAGLGYQSPAVPAPEGTIVEQAGRPRIGVWVMPDNRLPGMLEDFVSFLGANSDPLWSIAENCLDEIPGEDRKFAANHRSKAHIHTWLAWQEKPGLPLGLAITFHYLDANAEHGQRLVGWIRRLFQL